jgi:hypothetical protein
MVYQQGRGEGSLVKVAALGEGFQRFLLASCEWKRMCFNSSQGISDCAIRGSARWQLQHCPRQQVGIRMALSEVLTWAERRQHLMQLCGARDRAVLVSGQQAETRGHHRVGWGGSALGACPEGGVGCSSGPGQGGGRGALSMAARYGSPKAMAAGHQAAGGFAAWTATGRMGRRRRRQHLWGSPDATQADIEGACVVASKAAATGKG